MADRIPRFRWTPEIKVEICERIAVGDTLNEVAAVDGMPCKRAVLYELTRDPAFAEAYARARELQLIDWEDRILDIAADASGDTYIDPDTKEPKIDGDAIQRARLRIDTMKWLMARRLPRKYGDRVVSEHSGVDGAPIQIAATANEFDLARRIAFVLAKAERVLPPALPAPEGEDE